MIKALMGLEPVAPAWMAKANPLSYGGSPSRPNVKLQFVAFLRRQLLNVFIVNKFGENYILIANFFG